MTNTSAAYRAELELNVWDFLQPDTATKLKETPEYAQEIGLIDPVPPYTFAAQ